VKEFEKFYELKFSGRKLKWNHFLGTMDLKFTSPNTGGSNTPTDAASTNTRSYTLTVSVIQAIVLLLIDEYGQCSLSSVREALSTFVGSSDDVELRRHMLSMIVNPKCRLLVPIGGGLDVPKMIDDMDVWKWNESFTWSSRNVRVPLLVTTSAGETPLATPPDNDLVDTGIGASIEEDRKHLVEAGIVRIMKSRRILGINDIVIEVTNLLERRFIPSVDVIKGRVENLCDREFIRKDESDDKVYHYIA
jgi:cullin 3